MAWVCPTCQTEHLDAADRAASEDGAITYAEAARRGEKPDVDQGQDRSQKLRTLTRCGRTYVSARSLAELLQVDPVPPDWELELEAAERSHNYSLAEQIRERHIPGYAEEPACTWRVGFAVPGLPVGIDDDPVVEKPPRPMTSFLRRLFSKER